MLATKMRSFWAVMISLALLLGGVVNAEDKTDNGEVGALLAVKNKVIITSGDMEYRAKLGDKLKMGDKISTGPRGYAQIVFTDGGMVRLAGDSTIQVREYFYSNDPEKCKSDIKVDQAMARFVTGKIGKIAPKSYKVHTPTATIGIRGTDFSVGVGKDVDGYLYTEVSLSEGKIELDSKYGGIPSLKSSSKKDMKVKSKQLEEKPEKRKTEEISSDRGKSSENKTVLTRGNSAICKQGQKIKVFKGLQVVEKFNRAVKEQGNEDVENQDLKKDDIDDTDGDDDDPGDDDPDNEDPDKEDSHLDKDDGSDDIPVDDDTDGDDYDIDADLDDSDFDEPPTEVKKIASEIEVKEVSDAIENIKDEVKQDVVNEEEEEAVPDYTHGNFIGLDDEDDSDYSQQVEGYVEDGGVVDDLTYKWVRLKDVDDTDTTYLSVEYVVPQDHEMIIIVEEEKEGKTLTEMYDNTTEFFIIDSGIDTNSVGYFGNPTDPTSSNVDEWPSETEFYTSNPNDFVSSSTTYSEVKGGVHLNGSTIQRGVVCAAIDYPGVTDDNDDTIYRVAGAIDLGLTNITHTAFATDLTNSRGYTMRDFDVFFFGNIDRGNSAHSVDADTVKFYHLFDKAPVDMDDYQVASGYIFGKYYQGFGVNAIKTNSSDVVTGGISAAGLKIVSEKTTYNGEGTYKGFVTGTKVLADSNYNADNMIYSYYPYSCEYSTGITYTVDFDTDRYVSDGTISVYEYPAETYEDPPIHFTFGGKDSSIAYDREIAFSSITNSGDTVGTSLWGTFALPAVSFGSSEDILVPDAVMWGFWNIEDASENTYPGYHNFWVARMDPGETTYTPKIYGGGEVTNESGTYYAFYAGEAIGTVVLNGNPDVDESDPFSVTSGGGMTGVLMTYPGEIEDLGDTKVMALFGDDYILAAKSYGPVKSSGSTVTETAFLDTITIYGNLFEFKSLTPLSSLNGEDLFQVEGFGALFFADDFSEEASNYYGNNLIYDFSFYSDYYNYTGGVGLAAKTYYGGSSTHNFNPYSPQDLIGNTVGFTSEGRLVSSEAMNINFASTKESSNKIWTNYGNETPVLSTVEGREVLKVSGDCDDEPFVNYYTLYSYEMGTEIPLNEFQSFEMTFMKPTVTPSGGVPAFVTAAENQLPQVLIEVVNIADDGTEKYYGLHTTPTVFTLLENTEYQLDEWETADTETQKIQFWLDQYFADAEAFDPYIDPHLMSPELPPNKISFFDPSDHSASEGDWWRRSFTKVSSEEPLEDPTWIADINTNESYDWLLLDEQGIESYDGVDVPSSVLRSDNTYINSISIMYNYYEMAYESHAYVDDLTLVTENETISEDFSYKAPPSNAIFISKDMFYLPNEDAKDYIPSSVLSNNSYTFLTTLPGLEDYETLSWGMWSVVTPGDIASTAFGFFGMGNEDYATTWCELDDYRDAIASQTAAQVFNYSGDVLGVIFSGSSNTGYVTGSINFSIDFLNGVTSGTNNQISLNDETISLNNVSVGMVNGSLGFSGTTTWDEVPTANGIKGKFFNDPDTTKTDVQRFARESAGTFNATNGSSYAIGAFGANGTPADD